MKIALDARAVSHPQRGGFKTYSYQLLQRIARVDPGNCYLTYLDRTTDLTHIADSPNLSFRIIPAPLPGVGMVWREQVLVPRQLAADRAVLAHFMTNTGPLRSPCPTIETIHDTIAWSEPPQPRGLEVREAVKRWGMFLYNRYLSIATARRSIRVITVSENSRRDLVERFGLAPERVVVTYEAPSESFCPVATPVARQAVRERFRLTQPFLLALSSASPRKNALGLLDAYADLEPELRSGYQLAIVWTHGLWKDRFAARMRLHGLEGRVVFLDGVDDNDLLNLYNAASVFVFPSLAEGFGLPPLEAMACGTPVVASSRSCLPEILGDAALMVDPLAQGALSRALANALRTPGLLRELSDKGRAWVRRYSWDRCARETAHVYIDAFTEFKSKRDV